MAEKQNYEFTYKGKIVSIGAVQAFESGFKKRTIVIDKSADGKYKNPVEFVLKKEDIQKADALKVGMEVEVSGFINGREWTSPKTNKTMFFNELQIFGKIEVLSQPENSDTFAEAEGETKGIDETGDDDMPF